MNEPGSTLPVDAGSHWQAFSGLLDQALEMDEAQRTHWLTVLRQSDAAMASRIADLLAARENASFSDFLQGAAPLPAEGLASVRFVGRTVGPYIVEAEVGHGGMGSVWRARRSDGRFEGKVAIKFVHAAWIGSAGEQRFQIEGNLLGRLDHPNIARLKDAGVLDCRYPYLVLEYVEGAPIDTYCERHELSVEARIRLFLNVLGAVSHAHSNLIVHRDIKPANVFVTHDGVVKLLDFGIAKLLDGDAGAALTKSCATPLTPQYAAPEQMLGQPVTTATDVYSLGLVLYLLLTGTHPVTVGSGSGAQFLQVVLNEELIRPSCVAGLALTRRRMLQGDIDNILGKALKKAPAERYISVDAFADDLRRYLTHEPVQARPDTVTYRAAKFVRRHRGGAALSALALVAAIAGIVGMLRQAHQAKVQRDFAFDQISRVEAVSDLNTFLLSDAAPSGKPFTVNELLQRAEHIVDRQQGPHDATQIELMIFIGIQYGQQEEVVTSLRLLERAYRESRALRDSSVRAKAACALGLESAYKVDLPRAEQLIVQGLAELSDEPQFALDRVFCLRDASSIARLSGQGGKAVDLAERALRELRTSAFDTDLMELRTVMDVAEAYREAGQFELAVPLFQQAFALMTKLGRGDTQTAGTLLNNWALMLDLYGQPLQAEQIFRRAIDIAKTGPFEQSVSPMLLVNYARSLRQIGRLGEAAEIAERGCALATQAGSALVVNQAMMLRSQIYLDQRDTSRAAAMLIDLEPRLRNTYPPGHYSIAHLLSQRALITAAQGDFSRAKLLADEAVTMGETTAKSGANGVRIWANTLLRRAQVLLNANEPAAAEADASAVIRILTPTMLPGSTSTNLGRAYLALAQAQRSLGAAEASRANARLAANQFSTTLDAGNPVTRAALELSGSL